MASIAMRACEFPRSNVFCAFDGAAGHDEHDVETVVPGLCVAACSCRHTLVELVACITWGIQDRRGMRSDIVHWAVRRHRDGALHNCQPASPLQDDPGMVPDRPSLVGTSQCNSVYGIPDSNSAVGSFVGGWGLYQVRDLLIWEVPQVSFLQPFRP